MPDTIDIQTTITTIVAFAAIVMAIWNMRKIYMEAKQPSKQRDKRLQEIETHLDNEDKRLEDVENVSKLTLKAQLAIIDYMTDGQDNSKLNSIRAEIEEYLINR